MSWICPHQINDVCTRLRKKCQPSQKGCVLEGEVKFIDYQGDSENKKDLRNEGRQDDKADSSFIIQRRQRKNKK